MKIPSSSWIAIIVIVFFVVLALPLNYAMSSAIGVENASLILSAIYIILTSIAFFVIFKKYFS